MARLISSAIKFYIAGDAYPTIMTGLRHSDIFEKMYKLGIKYDKQTAAYAVQGFITSDDQFVDRYDAIGIAYSAGQISENFDNPILFSEDVWPPRKGDTI